MTWKSFSNRMGLLADYLAGRTTVRGYPISITAETTTRCQLQCPMCPRLEDEFPPMDMSLATFDRLWPDDGVLFNHIILYGFGEPLCDETFFEKAARAERRGAVVQVSTNGELLDEEKADAFFKADIGYLIFSLDAASRETYARVRPGADFDRTERNVLAFLEKNRKRGGAIFTVAQMILLPENIHEKEDFVNRWKDTSVSAVRLKNDEVRPFLSGQMPDRRAPCPVLWRGPFFIRPNGSVHPCCHMTGDSPLGNIHDVSWIELWNHPRMEEYRAIHGQGKGNEIPACSRCYLRVPGKVLTAGTFLPDATTALRMMPVIERLLNRGKIR